MFFQRLKTKRGVGARRRTRFANPRITGFLRSTFAGILIASSSALTLSVLGDSSFDPTAPTINPFVTTDRSDYQPGETAVIAGGGFEPNEVVQVQVTHADAHGSNSGNGHEPFAVTADADGNFSTQWFVDPDDSLGSLFLLTVDGSSGRHAEMMFTDTATTYVVNLKIAPTFGLNVPASGSWNPSRQSPFNDNYITGPAGGGIFRSFFGFDLPTIAGNVESVTLRAANPFAQGAATTWSVFDVSTPLTDLMSFGTRSDIWNDLGSGVLYASAVPDLSSSPASIVFNADGIAAVQAALGSEFLIGTDYGGFTSYPGFNQFIFGGSGGSATAVQLIITTADNQNQPPVAKCKNVSVSAGANCSATVSIDDGSFDPDASDVISFAQSPAGPYALGDTTVTLTVTDSHGLQSSCTAVVTVVDALQPNVTLSGNPSIIVQCHTSFDDPGAVATDDCAGTLGVTPNGAVDINTLGLYTLTYSAVDPAGNIGTVSRQVIVVDTIQPVVSLIGDASVTVECHGSFNDPGATASDSCAGVLDVSRGGILDLDTPGTYTLSYMAVDPSGNIGSATRNVVVVDTIKPTITLNGDATVTVGCHAAFNDAGATAFDTCAGALPVSTSGSVDLNTPGTYTLSYVATDPSGNSETATRTVIVVNTAPVITQVTGPVGPLPHGSSVGITVEFADADLSQAHDVVFTWGDGTTSTLGAVGGIGSMIGSHIYGGAGVYEVGVMVTDPCGSTAQSTFQFVVINDAAAGFVTGGGWIVAPKGAYTTNPNLSGKATFGFVSKYQKGSSTPSGNTQFNFHVAGFDFKSTSYEWLVVSGSRAQFKGSGKINGAGDYSFMITATDGKVSGGGDVDRFRIKINNKATGAVIFDNQTGASPSADLSGEGTKLQGGNISIQK